MFLLRPLYEAISDLTYEPWRIPDAHDPWNWTQTTHDSIREKIAATRPAGRKHCKKLNLLVIGPKAHGKSSLINTVASISLGDRTAVCAEGGPELDADSVTIDYKRLDFLGHFQGLRLCDVTGLTKSQKASENFLDDLIRLIDGHIKPGYKFDATKPITRENPHYNSDPTTSDMIHCVVIVFDIRQVYDVHSSHRADIQKIKRSLNEANIPVCVLLTKADKLDPSVRRNIENIYTSRKVLRAVERAEASFDVPKRDIHPIVNFADEIRFEWKTSLPALAALKSCVNMAKSHLYNDTRYPDDIDVSVDQKFLFFQ